MTHLDAHAQALRALLAEAGFPDADVYIEPGGLFAEPPPHDLGLGPLTEAIEERRHLWEATLERAFDLVNEHRP